MSGNFNSGTSGGNGDALLQVRDLKTYFPIKRGVLSRTVGYVKAVDGVSFDVHRGRTLGLVGESGCGKTTVGRSILRLIPATSGVVRYDGQDFLAYRGEDAAADAKADAGHFPGSGEQPESADAGGEYHRRADRSA